ncbi:MAG TPA: hypothetical protein VEP91_00915 [Solirubrobacterales bacterium]|nr:hypothetical protein [Solirubrobacterales bacterium]
MTDDARLHLTSGSLTYGPPGDERRSICSRPEGAHMSIVTILIIIILILLAIYLFRRVF